MGGEILDTLGKKILNLLNDRNLTQKELAKMVGTTEVSIGRYINDKREPNATMLAAIAKALNVSTDYLLGTASPHNVVKSKATELEEDFPEGISVLYRANKNLTPEQKEMMLKMINSVFFDDEKKD